MHRTFAADQRGRAKVVCCRGLGDPGDTIWVLRLWDFAQDEATVTIAHLTAMDAFFAAANLRILYESIIHGWSVVSIVGHASPEGEEGYNADLALRRAQAVAGASGVVTGSASSGEACGEGVPHEDYPYFRAVDVTIKFWKQSAPPQVLIPGVDEERGKSPLFPSTRTRPSRTYQELAKVLLILSPK